MHLGVLVLTMSEDDASVFAALRAGARGYVLKGATGEELVSAVRSVARGEAVYGAAVAGRIRRFLTEGRAGAEAAAGPFPELTAREREILDLLADGRSNAEIASALFLSPKTIEYHLRNVYAKLGVRSRTELATTLAQRVSA